MLLWFNDDGGLRPITGNTELNVARFCGNIYCDKNAWRGGIFGVLFGQTLGGNIAGINHGNAPVGAADGAPAGADSCEHHAPAMRKKGKTFFFYFKFQGNQ